MPTRSLTYLSRLLLCALIALVQSQAHAQPAAPSEATPGKIAPLTQPFEPPRKPTAPPSLAKKAPPDEFRCERQFIYQGETLPCDSNLSRDGENLRPIIKNVPSAVAELDQYQRTRKNIERTAYVGSAGLLIAVLGTVATSLFFRQENGGVSDEGKRVGRWVTFGGLGITAGSLAYGLTALQTNENRIERAVENFNRVQPDRPIELKFSTGF